MKFIWLVDSGKQGVIPLELYYEIIMSSDIKDTDYLDIVGVCLM